jgi:TRAP transporter TAXI family solute receptor
MTLRVFSAAGLVLCLAAMSCSGAAETVTAPPATLRLSRANASDLETALARIPHVKFQIVSEGGSSITSLLDLKSQKTNVSGTLADVAYLAYAGQLEEMSEPFEQLRGMAVTGLNTMHLLVGPHVRVRSLADLKGLRVSLGAPGSSTAHITLRMLQDLGIPPEDIRAERIPNAEIVSRLSSGEIDAAFSGFAPPSAAVTAAMKRGAKLIPVEGPAIEEMRTRYPYLKRTLILPGT